MNIKPESADSQGCPYLGVRSDVETRYSYPCTENYCHFPKKPEKVREEHQRSVCFTPTYPECPVFLKSPEDHLPQEIRLEETGQSVWTTPRIWETGGILVIIILIVTLIWINKSDPPRNSNVAPFTKSVLALETDTPSSTPNFITFSSTPTPTAFIQTNPTITPEPDLPKDELPTSSPGAVVPTTLLSTPGPALETPFGTVVRYLVHKVVAGDSLSLLANRYGTSEEVIKKINRLDAAMVLLPDQIIVLMPGKTTPAEAEALLPVFLISESTIEVIASQYGITPDEVRSYNDLSSEGVIPGERWLVFPFREVIPTLTPTPVPNPDLSRALTEPFGPEKKYILHQVQSGESMGMLARLYLTSTAVIQKINRIEGSIYENQVLVILLNQVDETGVKPLKAMFIENETSIDEIASALYVLQSEIIELNGLEEGETIPAGRWIIYPD